MKCKLQVILVLLSRKVQSPAERQAQLPLLAQEFGYRYASRSPRKYDQK